MSNRFALLSSAATIALMLAGPALAQSTSTPSTTTTPSPSPHATTGSVTPSAPTAASAQMSTADRNFAKEAAIGGMTEVDLGKLAQQNSQNDQVKQFGAKMVQDHSAANDQLQQLASGKGLTLPEQLDSKGQALHDRLARLQGPAFDRAYMADMVKDHNQDIAAFRRESQNGRDPELKQLATTTLQTIEQHDKLAHDVDRGLTTTGSSQAPRR